eukprot:TRINITY_DN4921_c0_g1_i1.p1 TRINITY_DN4921_c0_g1~~TRINITY_DN4921_c0_g1_i1.p1  ORF type:complete len:197 (-),score=49.04 TRINITY_DN4921_c0_g1_i1:164-754(-)
MSLMGKHRCFEKGYGFITSADGEGIFYHHTELKGKPPQEGDTLFYDLAESPKGDGKMVAVNVSGGTAGGQHEGIARNFSPKSGYGFIDCEGQSYFVHYTAITDNYLREGDKVWFDIGQSDKNPEQVVCKNVAGGTGDPVSDENWNAKFGKGKAGKGKPGMEAMMGMMAWFMQQMSGPYGKGKGKDKGKGKVKGKFK